MGPVDSRRFEMASSLPAFVRRSNPNGNIDSICTKCYATVTVSAREAELDSAELRHQCESWRLERFRKQVERSDPSEDLADRARSA